MLKNSRSYVLEKTRYRLDFDHRQALSDDDCITLAVVLKAEFDDLMLNIDDHYLLDTATRSTRTCLAILLLKLRYGLRNKLIATLLAMKKHQVNAGITFHPFTLKEF